MSTISLEIPDQLRQIMQQLASDSGVPLVEIAERALSEGVAKQLRMAKFEKVALEVSDADIKALLDLVPDVPPIPGDELPDDLREKLTKLGYR